MTNNSLIVYNDFGQIQQAAGALYKSGYFSDTRSEDQMLVKIMAGAEIGLPPFASVTGIHVIQGKPTLGANVIATLIKNDPRYNYRVAELTDAVCRVEFFENGEPCGVSEFTAQDARKAGTKNMEKFPKNMLFARAISNGAKWFTPGIFGGAPVYTPDELGADVDEEGNVIEGSYTVPVPIEPKPQPKPTNGNTRKTRVIDIPEVVNPDEVKLTARDDHEQHISPGDQPPNNLAAFAVWYAAQDGNYATNVDVVKKLTAEFGKDIGSTFGKRKAEEYIGVLSGKLVQDDLFTKDTTYDV